MISLEKYGKCSGKYREAPPCSVTWTPRKNCRDFGADPTIGGILPTFGPDPLSIGLAGVDRREYRAGHCVVDALLRRANGGFAAWARAAAALIFVFCFPISHRRLLLPFVAAFDSLRVSTEMTDSTALRQGLRGTFRGSIIPVVDLLIWSIYGIY